VNYWICTYEERLVLTGSEWCKFNAVTKGCVGIWWADKQDQCWARNEKRRSEGGAAADRQAIIRFVGAVPISREAYKRLK